MLLNAPMSTMENVLQLVGLIIVFVLILVATYLTTKWVGKTGLGQANNKNISVVETYKISQNKFIQIIKVGSKYIAVGISKDHIEYLTEIEEENLIFQQTGRTTNTDFKEIFTNMISKQNLKKRK